MGERISGKIKSETDRKIDSFGKYTEEAIYIYI